MIERTIRNIKEITAKNEKQHFIAAFESNWLNEVKKNADFNVVSFSVSKQFADSMASLYSNGNC